MTLTRALSATMTAQPAVPCNTETRPAAKAAAGLSVLL